MYRVFAEAEHYRRYGFFQLIREDRVNTASDAVEFWVKPGDVQDIKAPTFDNLSANARRILNGAEMVAVKDEDRDCSTSRVRTCTGSLGRCERPAS